MNTLARILLLWVAAAAPAYALDLPARNARDPNLCTQMYRPDLRTLLVGTLQHSTVITFGPAEHVKQVFLGNPDLADGPDVSAASGPPKNYLPIWPKKEGRTNFQVLTETPGQADRLYQFALETHEPPADGGDDPKACYGLTFTYPRSSEPAPTRAPPSVGGDPGHGKLSAQSSRSAAKAVEKRRQAEAAARLAAERLAATPTRPEPSPAPIQNWRYVARGDRELAPEAIFDDGLTTSIRFPPGIELPAIFGVSADGTEFTVTVVTGNQTLTLHRVGKRWRLRHGSLVLDIFNQGFEARSPTGTGTVSPSVTRDLRMEALP